MTTEPNNTEIPVVQISPQTPSAIEVSRQTSDMVDQEMAGETDEVRNETKALIDAIKKRAQDEAQSAGSLTRDAYLEAVRRARETIEREQLMLDPSRIENSFHLIQREAEKNWESVVKEVTDLGDRLAAAAQAAWDELTAPRP